MELSVVLPARNEEGNLRQLIEDVLAAFDRHGITGEVIAIDDGSTDGTSASLEPIDDPRLLAIRFPENRGRAHAIARGFEEAHGKAVAVMDSDRQYEPDDLPSLLAALETGADVANGVRVSRADNPWRRLVSQVYNLLVMRLALGVRVRDANSGLKAFRADSLPALGYDPDGFNRGHRFLIAWAVARGLRVVEVPIRHYDRPAGRSYIRAAREARLTLADLITFRRTVAGPARKRQRAGVAS
jgi:glycosyltransferase involved in cell wall biosynthesis